MHKKPRKWNLNPALVAPEWGWFWEGLEYSFPLWDYQPGADETSLPREVWRNRAVKLLGTTPGVAWRATPVGLGQDSRYMNFGCAEGHEYLRFTHQCCVQFAQTFAVNNGALFGVAEAPQSGTYDRTLFVNSSGNFGFYIFDGAPKNAISTTVAVPGESYDVVGTADGTNIRLYVNGVLEDSVAAGNAFTGYATPELQIGQGWDGSVFNGQFWGTFLSINVWDRALGAREVAQLATDPFGAFRMDDDAGAVYPAPTVSFLPAWAQQSTIGDGFNHA